MRQPILWRVVTAVLAILTAPELRGQYTQLPEAYSATGVWYTNHVGAPANIQFVRDGPKALVDVNYVEKGSLRTLYDLQSHVSYTWNPADASLCSYDTFSEDSVDPFLELSAELAAELARLHATQTGTAILNGMPVKILEADTPEGKEKAWVDQKYGLTVQYIGTPKGGQPQTILELKQLTVTKPPDSTFVLPPECVTAALKASAEAGRIASGSGCKEIAGSFPVDNQTKILYDSPSMYQEMHLLPPLKGKRVQSFECAGVRGSIYYFFLLTMHLGNMQHAM